jgi:hypothetical protein
LRDFKSSSRCNSDAEEQQKFSPLKRKVFPSLKTSFPLSLAPCNEMSISSHPASQIRLIIATGVHMNSPKKRRKPAEGAINSSYMGLPIIPVPFRSSTKLCDTPLRRQSEFSRGRFVRGAVSAPRIGYRNAEPVSAIMLVDGQVATSWTSTLFTRELTS